MKESCFHQPPARTLYPKEELIMEIPEGEDGVSCFIDHIKKNFNSQQATRSVEEQRDMQRDLLKKQIAEQGKDQVDSSMLEAALNIQMVQPVALLPGGTKTGFIHINMYVDDRGISKGLPKNERATGLSIECGMPSDVSGDAYIGRCYDKEDDEFARHDFTLAECNSGAEWVKRARELNAEKQSNAASAQEMMEQMSGRPMMMDPLRGNGGEPKLSAGGAPADGKKHRYEWSQEGEDVVVTINVPPETQKGHVKVQFKPKALHVEVTTLPAEEQVAHDGSEELFQEIVPAECSWSLINSSSQGRRLEITMTKQKEMRWLCFTRMHSAPEKRSD